MKKKNPVCRKVFIASCMRHSSIRTKRSLTACVLQMAALQSPVFTSECKFSRFALECTFLLPPLYCTDDSMGSHMLCIIPESIPGSQNNCTIETPQVETVQLKWDAITTTYSTPQSHADCGLMHFAASPSAYLQRKVQNLFAVSPTTVLVHVL